MATTGAKPIARTPDDRMTLTEHLGELRSRIIKCMLAITVGAVGLFSFYDPFLNFVTGPYRDVCRAHVKWKCDGGAVITDPLQGFLTRTRISGWGGLVLALPIVLWQVWRFVVPALHANEKRYAAPFIISSVGLFLFGGYIAWLVYPKSLEFLIGYSGPNVTPLFTVDKYVRLLTLMFLAFGTGFLFPVLLVFLQLVNVLTPRKLLAWWRQAIVGILVLAAVITPSGDLFSLFGLAIPMWVFYFAAILVGAILTRKRRRAAAASADE